MTPEIQKAVFAALSADTTLTDLLAVHVDDPDAPGIYDHVPEVADSGDSSHFPFVTIGEDRFEEWDTDTEDGFAVSVTINVWSRQRGRLECMEIMAEVYELMHYGEIDIEGYNCVALMQEFAEVVKDPDGITQHGVARYRLLTDRES